MPKKTSAEPAVAEDHGAEALPEWAEAPVPVRTVRSWAEAKGFLPELVPGPTPAGTPVRMVPNPEFGRFAGAKPFFGWDMERQVTEADFDAAVVAAERTSHH